MADYTRFISKALYLFCAYAFSIITVSDNTANTHNTNTANLNPIKASAKLQAHIDPISKQPVIRKESHQTVTRTQALRHFQTLEANPIIYDSPVPNGGKYVKLHGRFTSHITATQSKEHLRPITECTVHSQ